jgi:rhamnosyl/mannosyltransferase
LLKHKDKVKVAQNGIITADFELKPGDEERIKQIKEMHGGKKIVYFVGRHIPYKGIDFLIKADKYIQNDCVILIVGKGPHDKVLKKIPCSDRVKFLGRLSDEDLRCYSHAADIFAFSSVTKAEAFGVALSEAMYCKSVPVVFNIKGSGVNWVSVAGKTGEEVPLKDIKAYANAIDKILADDNLQHTYAEAARERIIKHFTAEIAVSVMNDIYKNL